MSDIRAGIVAELEEAGREMNRAVSHMARATSKLTEAVGYAKADGIPEADLLALAGIADPARPVARKIIRETPASSTEDFPWAT